MNTRDLLRQQRKLRELNASTARALTGDAQIHLRQQLFFKGNTPLNYGPHMMLQEIEQAEHLRGVADALSLRLLHSDTELHNLHRPKQAVARLIYDWLETLRCEALAPETLPGMRHNLSARFYFWSSGYHHNGHTQSALGILLFTVAQMIWSRLHRQAVYAETEDLIESTRANLSAELGADLAALRQHCTNQSAYIPHALNIASRIQATVNHLESHRKKSDTDEAQQKAVDNFALLIEGDEHDASGHSTWHAANPTRLATEHTTYQVFNHQFDTVTYIATTIRAELLTQYREQINLRRQAQHLPFHLLVQRLRRALLTPHCLTWKDDQEEGLLDGKRLTQLINSPMERRLFKKVESQWTNNASVSFLIDCSGSMKLHAETLTMMVDILSQALEKSGAKTEVLAYSTNAWNGGKPYRQWQARGRKPYPGRLNEIDHRILKDSDTPWRQANRSIMALLKTDLYREGIDGEAVQWAAKRLLQQRTGRKFLFVISDGFPMDSATALANDDNYLSLHLQQTLQHYQRQGIKIWGIGIGLDLSHLYPNNLIADFEKGLDNHFIDDFIHSLAKPF